MKNNSVICVGSNYFSTLRIDEIAQEENFMKIVYDRSQKNLLVSDLDSYLKKNIYASCPTKIFLNVGDVDLNRDEFNIEEFISIYEWTLFNLHTKCRNGHIYVLSVVSNSPRAKELNMKLKKMAQNVGCDFIDITFAKGKNAGRETFHTLKAYMRDFPIDFCDAMLSA